ncbi:DUF3772 domain-containing protein [Paracoccus sp. (in: a-proteobacteria)]|uniref:DUF3772 domain-containing protein n=1 Tax=Paracoccus sp. TaxID=267 RepID=UPI0032208B05
MSRLVALLLALVILAAQPLAAQEQAQAPDFAAWTKLAEDTEKTVEIGSANDKRLQEIRAEVVKWRERFKGAEGTNSTRIATLKEQISALGPLPAEGQTEAEDIAARRKELNDELGRLQAPGRQAVEAYGRADGIIAQIDRTIRERQTSAMIRQTASPLNPANWVLTAQEVAGLGRKIFAEVRDGWGRFGSGPDGTRQMVLTAAILLGALLLLSRGRRWVDSLPSRLSARASERSRAALIFAVSLGQILIPQLGLSLAVGALVVAGLFGDWGMPLLLSLPAAGLSYFSGLWLARRLFPAPGTAVQTPLPMPEERRAQARLRARLLALSLSLHQVFSHAVLPLSGFNSQNDSDALPQRLSEAAAGVLHLLLILFGALCLFRMCSLLRSLRPAAIAEGSEYRVRVAIFLAGAGRLVAPAAPVLAAAGFVTAANAVLWSSILTLALVGLLIILLDFIADFYAMAKGGDQAARDALMPVLMGFALILLSLPLFALIWGARVSDLAEAWTRAQQGFSLGGVRLSPMALVTSVVVFMLGYFLTNFVKGAFRNSILPKTSLDSGGQHAVTSIVGYVGVALAVLMAITAAGINMSSLAVVAGALSVGIGFGMQQVVSNFVSGIILLVERPIAVGDWIEVGGQQGIVRKMAVRATQIQTFDRTDIIVPNSNLITQPVTNWTRANLQGRIIVPVGVAFGSDTRKVERVLTEIAEDQPTVLVNPPPAVLFRGFAADSLTFEIRAVLADINGGSAVTSEIYHEIARRFAEEGIEIPHTQREIRLRDAEALTALAGRLPQDAPRPG